MPTANIRTSKMLEYTINISRDSTVHLVLPATILIELGKVYAKL